MPPVLRSRVVPGPRNAGFARFAHPAAVFVAAGSAGALAHRVLERLASADDSATLARALPGPLADVIGRFAGAPLVPAVFVALVPLLIWVACGALALALLADGARVQRWQALVWLVSSGASWAALLTDQTASKQGMAALGYALGWSALASFAAVLWASRLSRLTVVTWVTVGILAGLVVRALPVGWPGENSLSWWAMLPRAPRGPVLWSLVLVIAAASGTMIAVSRRVRLALPARLAVLTLVPALLLHALPAFEFYGHDKHAAALASEINTSYFQVAREMGERDAFVRGYAARMATLPMHASTHPPGWPLVFRAALDAGATPSGARVAGLTARALGADRAEADSLAASVAGHALPVSETSGLWLVVAWLALAVLALPFATYFAARGVASPDAALFAAAWAALLPAAFLYFPDVDVAHPVLYALALGAWLRRDRHLAWALAAGVVVAALVALSFGNLALYLACAAIVLLGVNGGSARPRREVAGAVLLLPLALLVAWAERAGARPFALYAEAMRQHHLILAHRTRFMWLWLNPLETAVALGLPSVLWLASHAGLRELWAGGRRAALEGGSRLFAGICCVLLTLELSGQTKGESGRLWMGYFPLLLAGAAPQLAVRARDWPRLSLLLAATLVVLKGFYVFVWLYPLG